MSKERPGRHERLEARLTELVKAGAPVAEIRAVQKAIEESEICTPRRDHSWALENILSDDTPDHAEESAAEETQPTREQILRAYSIFRGILSEVVSAPRPRMLAECAQVALGFRIGVDSVSMRDIAGRNGVTVEAISKTVEALRERFALPAVEQNKSERAMEAYRARNGRTKNA